MNEISVFRRLAGPLLVLPLLIGSLALGALPAGAAEETSASAEDVAAGLKKIQSTAEGIAKAAGTDGAKAEQLLDGIEPAWEKIESTVKANDQNAYLKLEENFTLLKIGVRSSSAEKATGASEEVAAAVTGYLDKHPAPAAGTPGSDSASSSETRSAAAATSGSPENPLPRTGPGSVSLLLAGMALGAGGLATIGGARRR